MSETIRPEMNPEEWAPELRERIVECPPSDLATREGDAALLARLLAGERYPFRTPDDLGLYVSYYDGGDDPRVRIEGTITPANAADLASLARAVAALARRP